MRQGLITLICFFLFTLSTTGQEQWDLERCVREAFTNSLLLRQANLNHESYLISGKQLRFERLPSLNASSNVGVSFGRFVNPATNDFETENSWYQSVGVQAGVTLFNGFRLNNSIRQNNLYVSATSEDIAQTRNDLALNVALAYLNVLFAYENLAIAENRVDLTQQQLDQLNNMIDAGTRPENDRYDLLAQVAIDQQSVIQAQNNIEINMLSLKQQMLLESDFPLEIERPAIDLNTVEALEAQSFEAVYQAALASQPQIKAAELRQQASELGVNIARSQMIPSLRLGANIGSNWSDLAKDATGFTTIRLPQEGVFVNGEETLFEVETDIPTGLVTTPYFDQLDNNLGYGFGATLSIPIFNNNSIRAGIEQAKITAIQADISTEQTKQTLKTNVQTALTAAKAARINLNASEASAVAARIAFENAERRAALGSINNFEYLSARNLRDTAENNLLIARYDYFFRIKVLEYYMGRGIQLD